MPLRILRKQRIKLPPAQLKTLKVLLTPPGGDHSDPLSQDAIIAWKVKLDERGYMEIASGVEMNGEDLDTFRDIAADPNMVFFLSRLVESVLRETIGVEE